MRNDGTDRASSELNTLKEKYLIKVSYPVRHRSNFQVVAAFF